MFLKPVFLMAFVALISARAEAQTADNEKSSQFAYCAAVAAAGKTASSNPDGQRFFGTIYTKYLWSALVFSTPEDGRLLYAAAVARHDGVYKASKSADEFSEKVVSILRNCETMQAENAERINAAKFPVGVDKSTSLTAQPGSTTPLDVMNAFGKPVHEDYNPDGRFVYNYATAIGYEVYLFDRQQKLIRVRAYCDTSKGKCQ